MSDKFMADLLQNLLSDQDVRACIEKLHTNAQELGKILAKQISTRVIDEVLTQSADVAPAQSQSVDAPKKAHGKRKSEWATASDASLRAAVFYRTKRNLPIEPELNNVLSARFRGWDATAHKFTRARAARKDENKTADVANGHAVPQTTGAIVPLYSVQADNGKFSLFFDDGKQKHRILSRATSPYELSLFDIQTQYAIVRKVAPDGQSHLYIIDCRTGTVIPAVRTGVEFVCWTNGGHTLYALQKKDSLRSAWQIMEHGRATKPLFIPQNTNTIRAGAIATDTILLDASGNAHTGNMIVLSDIENAKSQHNNIKAILFSDAKSNASPNVSVATPGPQPDAKPVTSAPRTNGAPAANKNELRVCVRPVKTTLNGTYNNVLVNGRKILSNHFDTDIKILSDGEILAIHGIVTDDKTLPETMQWRVYYADLTSAIPSIKQSYSGYNAHALSVHEMPDGGIRIDMSNRSSLLPRVERIRKLANGKKFVLDEKQR